jgi:thioredoxin 2
MAIPGTIVSCPNCGAKNRVRPVPSGVPRCSVCQTLLPWIVEATAAGFGEEITASVPMVERMGRSHAGPLKVVKLNVDEAPDISQRYRVQGIPVLVLIEGGKEVSRLVGAVPEADLGAWLERHLRPGGDRTGQAVGGGFPAG